MADGFEVLVYLEDDRFVCSEVVRVTSGVRETIRRGMIDTKDNNVRKLLISLGWTPPKSETDCARMTDGAG